MNARDEQLTRVDSLFLSAETLLASVDGMTRAEAAKGRAAATGWPRFYESAKTGLSRCIMNGQEASAFFRDRDPADWVLIEARASHG